MSFEQSTEGFKRIYGKEIEALDESYENIDSKNNTLFVDNSGFIHLKIEEVNRKNQRRRPILRNLNLIRLQKSIPQQSLLRKRKIEEAFGPGTHDAERYGQQISTEFFVTNIGHGVYQNKIKIESSIEKSKVDKTFLPSFPIGNETVDEAEIIDWCYKYLASKNKINEKGELIFA
jgi:hypothetical protein